jgi:UDP-N-acetylmuramyl pentapeptide phosphotransferase/UDP-N-acetylglucosamine-1-phosphate transferase
MFQDASACGWHNHHKTSLTKLRQQRRGFIVATVLTWGLLSALASSFAVCALLIVTQRWHGKHSLDNDLSGAQKIHHAPVPRVGGAGLAFGLVIAAGASFVLGGQTYSMVLQLLACAIPVFAAGFIEDLTKKVSVRTRLYASLVSAAMAAWILGANLLRLDTPVLDTVVSIAPLSIVFTCIAVGGMTHAVNIIDGLNGLAAGCVALMLGGLALIGWQVGDILVVKLCLLGIASLLGFLLLNFPFGRIFLGDGGAYLGGFWLAECAVLLLKRNPGISTWAVLLCCMYPVWETLFSIYRRHVHQHVSSGKPDMVHFHHLVYLFISKHSSPHDPAWQQHGLTSIMIWAMVLGCQAIAALSFDNTGVAFLGAMAFIALYQWIYGSIRRTFQLQHAIPSRSVVQVEGH